MPADVLGPEARGTVTRATTAGARLANTFTAQSGAMKVQPATNAKLVVQLSADELRAIIKDEVEAAVRASGRDDKLLTADEVANVLNCSPEWVYHHVKSLPFVRKVGGMLRFSSNGLQRYIDSKKFSAI